MEKDSIVKSTPPKKAAAKITSKAEKGEKTAPIKKASGKTKTTPKTKVTAKKIPAKAKTAAKKSISRKKKPTRKSLILKQCDRWTPEKPFFVLDEDKARQPVKTPLVASGQNEDEIGKIKKLLFKTFDLNAAADADQSAEIEKPVQKSLKYKNEERVEAKDSDKPKTEDEEKATVSAGPQDDKTGVPFVPRPPGRHSPRKPPKADPIDRVVKFFIAGLVLLILILIGSSYANTKNYYIKIADGNLEIWKGSFAPMGQTPLVKLVGIKPPPSIKPVYAQSEALTLAFNYYLDKADKLTEVKGIPDFEKTRAFLARSEAYATTQKQRTTIHGRLSHIDLMLLIYKADVASAKGTIDAFKKALNYLEGAGSLVLTKDQIKLVFTKKTSFNKQISDLKSKKNTNGIEAKKEKQNIKTVKEPKTSKKIKPGKDAEQKVEPSN